MLKTLNCMRTWTGAAVVSLFLVTGCGHTATVSHPKDLASVQSTSLRSDGNYDVVCRSGIHEIATTSQLSAGNICLFTPSNPLNILSMQLRSDGNYDVICVNRSRAVATSDQIRSSDICGGTPSPTPIPANVMDSAYFPAACTGTALTSAESTYLQQFTSGIPGMTQWVVQIRTCANRPAGPDCSPWSSVTGSDGVAASAPVADANGISRPDGNRVGVTYGSTTLNEDGYFSVNDTSFYASYNNTAQVTAACFRIPMATQTKSIDSDSYSETRAALISIFDADGYLSVETNSPFNPSSCAGTLTLPWAEGHFPSGSGATQVTVPAQFTQEQVTRTCFGIRGGFTCSGWAQTALSSAAYQSFAGKQSVTFLQQPSDVSILAGSGTYASVASLSGMSSDVGSVVRGSGSSCLRLQSTTLTGDGVQGWTETLTGTLVNMQ